MSKLHCTVYTFFEVKKLYLFKNVFVFCRKKKKSKKSHKDLDEPVASTSGSQVKTTSSGNEELSKGDTKDLEAKYYSKKTKSEVAFLKRKEQAVS